MSRALWSELTTVFLFVNVFQREFTLSLSHCEKLCTDSVVPGVICYFNDEARIFFIFMTKSYPNDRRSNWPPSLCALSVQRRLYKSADQWPLGSHQKQNQVGMISCGVHSKTQSSVMLKRTILRAYLVKMNVVYPELYSKTVYYLDARDEDWPVTPRITKCRWMYASWYSRRRLRSLVKDTRISRDIVPPIIHEKASFRSAVILIC